MMVDRASGQRSDAGARPRDARLSGLVWKAYDRIAKLDRVVAITRLENIASQRSLEKFMAREREITTDEGRTLVLYAAFNPNSGRRNQTGRTSPK